MRPSPRPPWWTVLLALLLAAGGCTTTPAPQRPTGGTTAPAPQRPTGGTTAPTTQPHTTRGVSPGVRLSSAVRPGPGLSVGLVTMKGLTGQRRPDPGGIGTQVAVQVSGAAWVGKLPARVWVWVPGPRTFCQDCVVLDPVRLGEKGSQWFVFVHDADAKLIDAWPVYGEKVQIPQGGQLQIVDDVDGGDPQVVDVDALKAKAGRR